MVRVILVLILTCLPAFAAPLPEAAAAGKLALVKNMLEVHHLPVDLVDEQGRTALGAAAQHGHLALCQYLVSKGAAVNFQSSTGDGPLHLAADANQLETSEYLLAQGARVNVAGVAGNTPLHNAHTVPMAQLLLRRGADAKAENAQGLIPFQYAVATGAGEVVSFYLARGADPRLPTPSGDFPLMMAASGGFDDVVVALLDKGVAVDTATEDGTTPLMRAAQSGLTSTVELLLKRGADRQRKDRAGRTAADLARKGRHKAVLKLLEGK